MLRRSVMISSTALDLPEHREQVRLACERAGFAPHDMMEHLPALDTDAVSASLEMVERADVYVGILAYRYGTIPAGADISITEMEYDHAVKLGKPRLMFLIHEDHEITGRDFDAVNAPKLVALKERVARDRVAAYFKSPEDLRAHVVEALMAFAKGLEEAEPEVATKRVADELHRRTPIPIPPKPFVAHPYTLLQTRELVGRQADLNLLTDWVTNPDMRDMRMLAVVAIGGMGKSAFSWKWFNQIAPNEMRGLAGCMWWSFYESDATFENFVIRALCYVSSETEQAVRQMPWPDREAMLLRHIAEKPYLFVLDGLERVLIAYNRMNASSLADDEYDQQTANYVAGAVGLPETAGQSFVGQHRLRQTTDLRAGALLQKLAMAGQSRFLLTTRLFPSALQLPNAAPRPGTMAYFLVGLNNDDALALWRNLGVSGARDELLPIFNSVQNHPLLLQALAGEIANYRKAPRDFAAWRADHPRFDPASLPLVQSRTHILQYALQGLSAEHRQVLHTIVGFRMPATYASLEALLIGSGKLFDSTPSLDTALSALEDRGLIGWDREANRYDAHPIVRGVVWQAVGAGAKKAVLNALDKHFEPISAPSWEDVKSIADLTPAIERYHTLIELGRLEDAFDLFESQLDDATLYKLATHQERVTWLESLREQGFPLKDSPSYEYHAKRIFHILGVSYSILGQLDKGEEFLRFCIEIYKDKPRSSRVALNDLAIQLLIQGKILSAEILMNRSTIYCRESDDRENEILSLRECILSEIVREDFKNTAVRFQRMKKIIEDEQGGFNALFCAIYSEYCLAVGKLDKAREYAHTAWTTAGIVKAERYIIRAALLQGRAALALGDYSVATERLHHALVRSRAANVVEFELPALVSLAQLDFSLGRIAQARLQLDEAWESIQRGPFLLIASDAYHLLAEIEHASGNDAAAIDAATKAFTSAWCDGPPYAYARGLRLAQEFLVKLGARLPVLPPFDRDRLKDLVEVEINPKDDYWVDPDALDFD